MKNRFLGLSMFFWFKKPSKCDILALFRTVKLLKIHLSIQNLGVKQEFIDSCHDNAEIIATQLHAFSNDHHLLESVAYLLQ